MVCRKEREGRATARGSPSASESGPVFHASPWGLPVARRRKLPAYSVLAGLVLGVAGGMALGQVEAPWGEQVIRWVEPVGALWVNAIRMTVLPLVMSLLFGGIAGAGAHTAARVGGRALGWFVGLVSLTASLAGLAAPPLFRLLGGASSAIPDLTAAAVPEVTLPPFRDWFVGLLPSNPVQAAARGDILPVVLFTVVFGAAATRLAQPHRDTLLGAARALSELTLVVVGWVLAVAPVGVFALTLHLASQTGGAMLRAVGGFLLAAGILLLAAIAFAYGLAATVGGVPLRIFARACLPPQAVAFGTRSSMAALPVCLEEAERTLKLPAEVYSLVLPAAVSVFKYASPITRITGTYMVASLFGVELGAVEWAAVVGFLALLSFYSPGIPSGGLFVMAPIYQAFGLPLEGIGILIALDLIPDMLLTVANVTGNMAVTAVVGGRGEGGEPAVPLPREGSE